MYTSYMENAERLKTHTRPSRTVPSSQHTYTCTEYILYICMCLSFLFFNTGRRSVLRSRFHRAQVLLQQEHAAGHHLRVRVPGRRYLRHRVAPRGHRCLQGKHATTACRWSSSARARDVELKINQLHTRQDEHRRRPSVG